MYQTDFEEFKQSLSDLCVAVNRPFNDDLVRVFWDDLKRFPLTEVKQRASYIRASGKRNFVSTDLRPESRQQAPSNIYAPPPEYPKFHGFGQRCLMKFLLSRNGETTESEVQQLVIDKNRLLRDFRQIDAEGEEVTADQVREAMFRAFDRVLSQRAAA